MDSSLADEPNTSSAPAPISSASRRRMTFRPPTRALVSPLVPSTSMTESELQNVSGDGETMQTDDLLMTEETPKTKKPWSFEDVCAFYDAIKSHGKDFDSVVKVLEKKKVVKTKDQVKTFFFNSAKTYRQLLSLTEDELSNVSRDARELFLVVNACEWKKRTLNMKVAVEKLRELLFEGVVTAKVGRKLVTIKTPPCPALCRYFSCRKAERIPTEVFIHLEPTSNGDHALMRSRNYNPYLRVKMNVNDRIGRLLEFITRKWALNGEVMSVTLWPDSACEVASLAVQKVETSPFISVSLIKLKKHIEDTKERMETKKQQPNTLQMAPEVNIKPKATYDIFYPKPFALTDSMIAEGLTLRNVKASLIAELFCVCGKKNPIQLRYQIHSDQQAGLSKFEPWKIMIDLLKRGYGDSLAESRKEDEKDRRREKREAIAAEPVSKKKKAMDMAQRVERPIGNPVSDIVRQETEEFESQIAMLRKTQRQKSMAGKRKNATNPVLSTGTPRLSVRPAVLSPTAHQSPTKHIFAAPKCTIFPRRTPGKQGTLQAPAKTLMYSRMCTASTSSQGYSSNTNSMPTDFSSVVFSPAKKKYDQVSADIQRKRNSEFLSSIHTADDNSNQNPHKMDAQAMFGDISMSPGSTRHASHTGGGDGGANESVLDFTELMYQNLEHNGDSIMSNPNLDFSVSEVHQTYSDMMCSSQDSHDFLFQHFQKKSKPSNPSKKPKK